jgi:RHH-type transcriptional regulator, rel operon repressor / antitoxin RelB
MPTIRLTASIELRFNALAEMTERTIAALAREAILEFIGDLEDFYLAEARCRKNRRTIPLAEIERQQSVKNHAQKTKP